jgi:hypothetical protein
MRSDMDKVLVERPRLGGKRTRTGRREPLDVAPLREGINPKTRTDRKSLNENLSPLKKYLLSQVGRPWDKVYSEIRKNISMDNVVQRHITEHLFQYVKKNVRIEEDGKIFEATTSRYASKFEMSPGEMYVCPKSGILKKVRARRRVKVKPKVTRLRLDSKRMAVLKKLEDRSGKEIGEAWFEVVLAPIPNQKIERFNPITKEKTWVYPSVLDVFRGAHVQMTSEYRTMFGTQLGGCSANREIYGDGNVYATKAKQMNSRELRKAGL